MKTEVFTEKRPADIVAVKWRGDPAEALEFVLLWSCVVDYTYSLVDESLTIRLTGNADDVRLVRGSLIEVVPCQFGTTEGGIIQYRAKRVLTNDDLAGYQRK